MPSSSLPLHPIRGRAGWGSAFKLVPGGRPRGQLIQTPPRLPHRRVGYIFRAFHRPAAYDAERWHAGQCRARFPPTCWMKLLEGYRRRPHRRHLRRRPQRISANDIYPDYKMHRPETPRTGSHPSDPPDDPTCAFNVPAIEQNGFEADDLIATYAEQAVRQGADVTVVRRTRI